MSLTFPGPSFLRKIALAALFTAVLALPAPAATIASCNATGTLCQIPENIQLQLPFLAIAGDVVLIDPGSGQVSDVFRIFNNFFDTGAGTGTGNLAFLYSADETVLPTPSTYSANVVFLQEDPSGITSYVGNGTNYLLGAPEPYTAGLLAISIVTFVFCRYGRAKLHYQEQS